MKNTLIFAVFFLVSCSSTRYHVQIPKDQLVEVEIKKIHNTNGVSYLYGILDDRKIRIAAHNEKFDRNKIYILKLTSLGDLLVQYNAMPVSFCRINLSDYGLALNDSTYLRLQHKKYKDLYLTEDLKDLASGVLQNIPMLKK